MRKLSKKEKAGKKTNKKGRHNPAQNKKMTNELIETTIMHLHQHVTEYIRKQQRTAP